MKTQTKQTGKKLLSGAFTAALLLSTIATNSIAGPMYGVETQKNGWSRSIKLFNPDPYNHVPAGREGGTIGLAVLPNLTPDSDEVEKAISELVGHIPSINMAITLPKNDIMYLFKFLKHLKATGRKVDVLMIGGHALGYGDETSPTITGINLKASGVLTSDDMNVSFLQKRIEQVAADGKNPAHLKNLCDHLKLIKEGSSALVPGAQLILHSCYLGSENADIMTKAVGSSFLGVNGGTAYGPNKVIAHTLLGVREKDPSGLWNTIKATMVDRSLQVSQSLKSQKWLRPGDAFVNTNTFTSTKIPAGVIKIPCQCDPTASSSAGSLQRTAPDVKKEIYRKDADVKITDNSFTITYNDGGKTQSTTVDFTPPPLNLTPGQPFTISSSVNSNDTSMGGFWEHGWAFNAEPNRDISLSTSQTSDQMTLVASTKHSERQRANRWIKFAFHTYGAAVTQTWKYNDKGEVVNTSTSANTAVAPTQNTQTQSRVALTAVPKTPSQADKTKVSTNKNAMYQRTGPFITQAPSVPGTDVQVSIKDNEMIWTGSDMYKKQKVSCTLKFDAPPEELSPGDSFMLSSSLSGSEDVAPLCQYLPGEWIKAANPNSSMIGLGKDNYHPSSSSSFEVQDAVKEIEKALKTNPNVSQAQINAAKARAPKMLFTASGPVLVRVEWRYVRK